MRGLLVVLLLLLVFCSGANVCFASFGGSHLTISVPIIQTLLERGHNLTVFVPSHHLRKTQTLLKGVHVLSGHGVEDAEEEDMPDGLIRTLWSTPRLIDALVMKPVIEQIIGGFMKQSGIQENRVKHCHVVVVDPFQALYGDAAARVGIPAVFIHNFISIMIPPESPLVPFNRILTAAIGGQEAGTNPIVHLLHRVLAPLAQSLSLYVSGFRVYGYPRALFSAVYARPLFVAGSRAMFQTSTPPSVIPLGMLRVSAPPLSGRGSYLVESPGCKPFNSSKLLYAAFGSHIRVPKTQIDKLCDAFRQVLDSGEVDHVLFSFRPLLFEPDTCHKVCNDERISTGRWSQQRDVLFSGAAVSFLTHGGYASLLESISAKVPVVAMPLFGDQPENGDWAASVGIGSVCDKTLNSQSIASVLISTIKNRKQHVAAITALLTEDEVEMQVRAANLLEKVAAEGLDNSLQRLVSPDWAVYASNKGVFLSAAFWGQILFWTVFVWTLIKLVRVFTRCCCRFGTTKLKKQ